MFLALLSGCGSTTAVLVRVDAEVFASATEVDDTGGCEDGPPAISYPSTCNPTHVTDDHAEVSNTHVDDADDVQAIYEIRYSGRDAADEVINRTASGHVEREPFDVAAVDDSRVLYEIDADASLVPIPNAPLVSNDGESLRFEYVTCGTWTREVHTVTDRSPFRVSLYPGMACCGWSQAPAGLGTLAGLLAVFRRRPRS